jgi:hypothetical protein
VELSTEAGCGLAIGGWPRFAYNACGGGGKAACGPLAEGGWQALAFNAEELFIPALSWRTTRLLGLPLPPGLRIDVRPQKLEGRWQPGSGAVELSFEALFQFTIGARLFRAPDLVVATRLTTGEAVSKRHRAEGQSLDAGGRGRLVGVATVAPCGNDWLDRFLGLPDEALAVLRCRLVAPNP